MSMYFYDETDDWPEYKIIKDEIHHLENEHRKIQKKILKAESAIGSHIEDMILKAKVEDLKKNLKEIEIRLEESLGLYR